jgi:hypothetical protein
MTQRRIRRVAAAAALATVLGFTAPAHAVDWQTWTGGVGWIEGAVRWIGRLWMGEGVGDGRKAGFGIDPNGATTATTTQPPPDPDRGHGIDPNG